MSNSRALMRVGAAALLCAGVAGAMAAAPAYRLINLDGFEAYSSAANGISESGLVTGSLARSGFEAENQLGTAFLYDGAMHAVGTGYVNGRNHGYLLLPVPEPGTYVLLLAGLGMIAWRLSSRRQPGR